MASVKHAKCCAFVLVPDLKSQEHGILDVDGELIKYEPIVVEVLPSVARIITPQL